MGNSASFPSLKAATPPLTSDLALYTMPTFRGLVVPKSTRISRPALHASMVTVPRHQPPAEGHEKVASLHALKFDGGGGGLAKQRVPTYVTDVSALSKAPSIWQVNFPYSLPGPEGFGPSFVMTVPDIVASWKPATLKQLLTLTICGITIRTSESGSQSGIVNSATKPGLSPEFHLETSFTLASQGAT